MRILQVGLGNFGKRHLEAWHRLGFGGDLWIAEPDESKWKEIERYGMPKSRLLRSASEAITQADIVDIVTSTDSHVALCREALAAGKDVFVEKPMTPTAADAREIAELAQRMKRLMQVGFYYRYHPIAQRLKAELSQQAFGSVRYLTGNFCGFKRARNDVGVTHTDGIHFIDLFNWLLGAQPVEVYALCRDHFGRGLEDFSIVLLTYSDGTVAKVESGYIQPGRWKDKVVPGAMTTKEIAVMGKTATAEADFETETLVIHDVHHELKNGVWTAVNAGAKQIPLEPCDPVQMVCGELSAFLKCVETRRPTEAGPVESGVNLAVLMEAVYESAAKGAPVRLETAVGAEAKA